MKELKKILIFLAILLCCLAFVAVMYKFFATEGYIPNKEIALLYIFLLTVTEGIYLYRLFGKEGIIWIVALDSVLFFKFHMWGTFLTFDFSGVDSIFNFLFELMFLMFIANAIYHLLPELKKILEEHNVEINKKIKNLLIIPPMEYS